MSDKQHQKMCIYAVPDADEDEGFRFALIPENRRWWMDEQDVCVGVTVVSFDPPDNMSREQMALKAVETLRDKIKQTQADAQMKINKLQTKIDGLLLLTYQSDDVLADTDNIVDIRGMPSMTCHFEIDKQIANTMLLRDVAVRCKKSKFLNLNVVRREARGETYRCLFGFYQEQKPEVAFTPESAADHFGISGSEFSFLFGASNFSTIGERLMMIDAHIQHLNLIKNDADKMERVA